MARRLKVVASVHEKGGSGKTATLGSLGLYLDWHYFQRHEDRYDSERDLGVGVALLDLDKQGSLYRDFESDHVSEVPFVKYRSRRNRDEIIERFVEGGFSEVLGTNSSIAYLPTEIGDEPTVMKKLKQEVQRMLDDENCDHDLVLLCDYRPAEIGPNMVSSLACLSELVDEYFILTVSRNVQSDIVGGLETYEDFNDEMVDRGIDPEKIEHIQVVNFAPLVNILAEEEDQFWEDSVRETLATARDFYEMLLPPNNPTDEENARFKERLTAFTEEFGKPRLLYTYNPEIGPGYFPSWIILDVFKEGGLEQEYLTHKLNAGSIKRPIDPLDFNERSEVEVPEGAIVLPEVKMYRNTIKFAEIPLHSCSGAMDGIPPQIKYVLQGPTIENTPVWLVEERLKVIDAVANGKLFDPFGAQKKFTSQAMYVAGIKQIAERIMGGL